MYAAERSLPRRLWRPAARVDLVKIVRTCVGPDVEIRWGSGATSYATHEGDLISLGKTSPAFVAYHESAHILTPDDRGHGPVFVSAYLDLVEKHGPSSMFASLRRALADQGWSPAEQRWT